MFLSHQYLKNRYVLMSGMDHGKTRIIIDYDKITGLTVLMDEKRDLQVLRIRSQVIKLEFVMSGSVGSDSALPSDRTETHEEREGAFTYHFPLFYYENEAFVRFISEKSGIAVETEPCNIRQLRERRDKRRK